MQFSEFLC